MPAKHVASFDCQALARDRVGRAESGRYPGYATRAALDDNMSMKAVWTADIFLSLI